MKSIRKDRNTTAVRFDAFTFEPKRLSIVGAPSLRTERTPKDSTPDVLLNCSSASW